MKNACEHGYYPKAECDGFFANVARDGIVFNEPPSARPAPQGRPATSGEEQMRGACLYGDSIPKADCEGFFKLLRHNGTVFNDGTRYHE